MGWVVGPFGRVDARWARRVVVGVSEYGVGCVDARCDRGWEELSGVSDSRIVDERWHPEFRSTIGVERDAGVEVVFGSLTERGVGGGERGYDKPLDEV